MLVSTRCVPNQLQNGDPKPCASVDLNGGYVILKDRRGLTQYLLIPTMRVSGIESAYLLAPGAPNYFADAWRERGYVERAAGRALPRPAISLAINSAEGRSQNQLHIHIDCIRADVQEVLGRELSMIADAWAPLSEPLVAGHHYRAIRVLGDTLDGTKTVWEEISGGLDQLQLGKREVNSRAYCAAFNFKGADQQKKVGQLSGGERNRVHLAKMLKSGANVLLLDEPTNDLDVDTLRALEEALEDFAGCAVIISHDRWFLDRIATHILAFESDSRVEWFEGNYQDYEKDKMRRLGIESVIPQRIKYKKFSR